MSSWNFLCCQLSTLPPSFLLCNSKKGLASSYLWPSALGSRRLLSDCATPSSLYPPVLQVKQACPTQPLLGFCILQPANHCGGSLLDSFQFVNISSLAEEGSDLKTRLSIPDESAWVLSIKNNRSSQPIAFNLANAAWYVVNFHCHKILLLTHVQPAVHQNLYIFFCRSGPSQLFHSLC